jgi:two-component system chemotaxis response regulator CheY
MRDSSGSPRPTGEAAPAALILIVDDTQTSAVALEVACSGIAGMDVLVVSSALEAVQVLGNGNSRVCAVVTDLRMPAMDGFQLIEFIRSRPGHAGTPVVVVTADTAPDTWERAARLGADACFPKPFSPGAVRQTLERLLHAHKKPN